MRMRAGDAHKDVWLLPHPSASLTATIRIRGSRAGSSPARSALCSHPQGFPGSGSESSGRMIFLGLQSAPCWHEEPSGRPGICTPVLLPWTSCPGASGWAGTSVPAAQFLGLCQKARARKAGLGGGSGGSPALAASGPGPAPAPCPLSSSSCWEGLVSPSPKSPPCTPVGVALLPLWVSGGSCLPCPSPVILTKLSACHVLARPSLFFCSHPGAHRGPNFECDLAVQAPRTKGQRAVAAVPRGATPACAHSPSSLPATLGLAFLCVHLCGYVCAQETEGYQ